MHNLRRVAFLVLLACACVRAPAAELAPTGVLRATYNSLNPGDARFDRRRQMVVGPVAELTKELARKLGVPFEMSSVEGAPAVIETVKTGHADIAYVPCDPTMAGDVAFSQPYVLVRGAAQCIVVAKGAVTKLETINRFIDDLRASGKLDEIAVRTH